MPRAPSFPLALVLALAACAAGAGSSDDAPLFAGEPVAAPGTDIRVLPNPGFVVGYSDRHRQPLWVAYQARSVAGRTLGPRPDRFSPDPRSQRPVSPDDYPDRRYDRGHLAPNYLIGKLYGADAQRATFLMTNVAPQTRRLNQLVWQRLEEAEADAVAPNAAQLWVVVGPIFEEPLRTLRSGIPVPAAFFRIWLDVSPSGEPRMLAFIVPQDVCGTEALTGYATSVDDVERRTGLDFFHELEDGIEIPAEGRSDPEQWWLADHDRQVPRYAKNFPGLSCD